MTEVLVVVVAAGPGLGSAVAARFAREGWAVGLIARTAGSLQAVAADVRRAGPVQVATAQADVADEQALREALRTLAAQLGPTTVLVYNGSAYVTGSALTLGVEDLRLAVDVGVTGAMVAVQEAAAGLREAAGRGAAAAIVLTGSVAADLGSTVAPAVGVAKAGLRSLARSLHQELAPDGVRVVSVTVHGTLHGPNALDLGPLAETYWQLVQVEESPEAVVDYPSG